MADHAARAMLVSAPDVADGVTTSVSRSEIEEVLGSEGEPIELVLDVTRSSDGETPTSRNVAVTWERSDLEQLLEQAAGGDVILTFDGDALRRAVETDVEAHGIRETVLALAVAATAASGAASTASARVDLEPVGAANATVAQVLSPDDRAVSRATPTPTSQFASDDRAVSRATPTPAPTLGADDRAVPRATPVQAPSLAPDDRAVPRATPVEAPSLSPDDRAGPRAAPVEAPSLSPDDRAVPRGTTPVTTPVTGPAADTDTGPTWAPGPSETVILAGGIALAIAGAFFLVSGRRIRPRPA